MTTAQKFKKELASLAYVCKKADNILLIAHSNPDPDTVGANAALKYVLENGGKHVDIVCRDPFPEILKPVLSLEFLPLDKISLKEYDAIIASDSVERGPFEELQQKAPKKTVTALIDHHPQIALEGDITIIDEKVSSASEIVYEFLLSQKFPIDTPAAAALLLGILHDTGNFQHPCTSTRVLDISSDLLKRGAPLQKIITMISANRHLSTLRLWGKALNKTKIHKKKRFAVTAITEKDFKECGAKAEEISQIAQTLSTIPDIDFGLVLHQKDPKLVRGSLRAQGHSKADLNELAKQFGGGGHRLASGFELAGVLKELPGNRWVVE